MEIKAAYSLCDAAASDTIAVSQNHKNLIRNCLEFFLTRLKELKKNVIKAEAVYAILGKTAIALFSFTMVFVFNSVRIANRGTEATRLALTTWEKEREQELRTSENAGMPLRTKSLQKAEAVDGILRELITVQEDNTINSIPASPAEAPTSESDRISEPVTAENSMAAAEPSDEIPDETSGSEVQEISIAEDVALGAYSDEDIYLLAQLIYNESNGQSYEGMTAVAEVVLNRIQSDRYPDTVYDVIYDDGQFSNSAAIQTRKPSEEMIKIAADVLNGSLRVLNNESVLYFRNSMITSGIPASVDMDWGEYDYIANIGDHAFYSDTSMVMVTAPVSGLEQSIVQQPVTRENFLDVAEKLAARITGYEWGAKPNGIGDANTRLKLDCSGYISWVYMTAYNRIFEEDLMGTANICNAIGAHEIKADQLSIGDIGMKYKPGSAEINHIGIYAGDGIWIHCNSSNDGISIENTDVFQVYYSLF